MVKNTYCFYFAGFSWKSLRIVYHWAKCQAYFAYRIGN